MSILISFIFLSIGLVGLIWGADKFISNSSILARKIGFSDLIIGLTLIIFFSAISEKNVYKIGIIIFIIFFLSLLLVPIFGIEVKGSKRWLDFPIIPRFQPVEFLKPFLIIFLSLVIGSRFTSNIYFWS